MIFLVYSKWKDLAQFCLVEISADQSFSSWHEFAANFLVVIFILIVNRYILIHVSYQFLTFLLLKIDKIEDRQKYKIFAIFHSLAFDANIFLLIFLRNYFILTFYKLWWNSGKITVEIFHFSCFTVNCMGIIWRTRMVDSEFDVQKKK